MGVRLHADDFGACPSVSRTILALYDAGKIDGFSVLVTGDDLAEHRSALRRARPGDVSLHLNLAEGRLRTRSPLLEAFLSGAKRRGFFGFQVWMSRLDRHDRRAARRAIAEELDAQLDVFVALVQPARVLADG